LIPQPHGKFGANGPDHRVGGRDIKRPLWVMRHGEQRLALRKNDLAAIRGHFDADFAIGIEEGRAAVRKGDPLKAALLGPVCLPACAGISDPAVCARGDDD